MTLSASRSNARWLSGPSSIGEEPPTWPSAPTYAYCDTHTGIQTYRHDHARITFSSLEPGEYTLPHPTQLHACMHGHRHQMHKHKHRHKRVPGLSRPTEAPQKPTIAVAPAPWRNGARRTTTKGQRLRGHERHSRPNNTRLESDAFLAAPGRLLADANHQLTPDMTPPAATPLRALCTYSTGVSLTLGTIATLCCCAI